MKISQRIKQLFSKLADNLGVEVLSLESPLNKYQPVAPEGYMYLRSNRNRYLVLKSDYDSTSFAELQKQGKVTKEPI